VRVEETTELVFERVAGRTGRQLAREGARARGRLLKGQRLERLRARRSRRGLGRNRRPRRDGRRNLVGGAPAIFDAPAARRGERACMTGAELTRAGVALERGVEPHSACRGIEGERRDGNRTTAGASTLPCVTTTRATLDHDIEGTCPAAITGGNLTAAPMNARG